MLVIDIKDDLDVQAKKDTIRRKLSYREQGWKVIDPAEGMRSKNTRAMTRAIEHQPATH